MNLTLIRIIEVILNLTALVYVLLFIRMVVVRLRQSFKESIGFIIRISLALLTILFILFNSSHENPFSRGILKMILLQLPLFYISGEIGAWYIRRLGVVKRYGLSVLIGSGNFRLFLVLSPVMMNRTVMSVGYQTPYIAYIYILLAVLLGLGSMSLLLIQIVMEESR